MKKYFYVDVKNPLMDKKSTEVDENPLWWMNNFLIPYIEILLITIQTDYYDTF